jgi:hypothetical protein
MRQRGADRDNAVTPVPFRIISPVIAAAVRPGSVIAAAAPRRKQGRCDGTGSTAFLNTLLCSFYKCFIL